MYALIQNNTFIKWIVLQRDYPNTSFPDPVKVSDLPADVVVVEVDTSGVNPSQSQVAERQNTPIFKNNKWQLEYGIRDKTAQELAEDFSSAVAEARKVRDQLLLNSDWTQVADSPVDKAAWAVYRQALRDITSSTGFPNNIQWPLEPA